NPFNFNPPGARSTAMGSAFVGLADDATAAATNPAGLTTLLYPEVSFEFKTVEYTWNFFEEGATVNQVNMPSFASLVVPVGNLRLAAFRGEVVHLKVADTATESDPELGEFTVDFSEVFKVENYGAGLALRAAPAVALGVAAGAARFSEVGHFSAFGETESWEGENFKPFASAGVLLRAGTQVTVGAAYHFRPTFEIEEEDPTVDPEEIPIPDSFGAGLSFRPRERLTLAASFTLNRYSELDTDDDDEFAFDDGVDAHVGGEYVLFLGATPLALRAGVQRVASSAEFYEGSDPDLQEDFPEEDPQIGAGLGFGVVLGSRFQVDVAGAATESRTEGVISLVYRFGRH
ncbi:MAG: hypothetical protein HY705_09630, partial [Gemmatimonadetes bacterium]|nr:hypothetical protein [Gemmatimonadota bacterium]